MRTYCIRQQQVEVGVIEHGDQEFAAFGASVVGQHLAAYTRIICGDIVLATWCGKIMLACRYEVVARFWSGSLALVFRLPRGRFIVGYALADQGMLFRGELLVGCDDDDARNAAQMIADHFAELDAEHESEFTQAD